MRFNNKQIEELFASAVKAKRDGVSLVEVFNKTAERYGMSAGSVRNIYYSNLKRKNQKGLRAKKIQPFATCKKAERIEVVFPRATSTFLSISSSSCLVNG